MNSLKRMADKLGRYKDIHNLAAPPAPSPATTGYGYDYYPHRASISTQASGFTSQTTTSDWLSSVDSLSVSTGRQKGSYQLTDFIIQRTLGTGSFGRVHLVRSKHNLRFYAVKVLNKEKIVRMKQIEHTNNEQMILESIQHPFIINLWGAFQDPANLYMVMDFVPGGELFTLLRRSNRFPDAVAKFYAAEVAVALDYLHNLHCIYRDLKPENILLSIDGHIKIADFGFAKQCTSTTWTLCGTPDYLAPEIVGQRRYNKSVDWYALGVLIYEMIWGLPPFYEPAPNQNPVVLYEKIQKGMAGHAWPPHVFTDKAKDMILKLMELDPSHRIGNMVNGSVDVFSHVWFQEVDWDKLTNREITAPYLPRVVGEGDASAFEKYPEENATMDYGLPAEDPFGSEFPGFDYATPPPPSEYQFGLPPDLRTGFSDIELPVDHRMAPKQYSAMPIS